MNIFDWLPQPGQKKEIPGGVIFCESWEQTTSRNGQVEGTITFKFFVDNRKYKTARAATVETPALGSTKLCLK